jgi:anti-anti-sigma factor
VVATVTLTGELDITTAPSLTRSLLEVGAAHPDRLVLDLSGLVLVDVAGARALDEAHTLLQAECPVILRTPRPSARKFLGLAGRMEGYAGSGPGHQVAEHVLLPVAAIWLAAASECPGQRTADGR